MPKVIDVEVLFEATINVFAENGYQSATTQEIARRAGINEVTLFRRYGSKAGLITAALAHQLAQAPFAHLAVTDDVEADLAALVQAYAETFRSYGGAVLTLLTEAPRHPELREAMTTLLPNLRNAAQVIAAHQARGRIKPGDPLQLVMLLIAPLLASGLWSRTGAPVPAADLDPKAVVGAFLDGHRRTAAPSTSGSHR